MSIEHAYNRYLVYIALNLTRLRIDGGFSFVKS